MKRKLLVLTAVIATALMTGQGTAQAHRLSGHPATLKGKLALAKAQVNHDKLEGDNHWLALDKAYAKKLKAALAPKPIGASWLVNAFLCIHSHEGSWTDPNPPYFGGLQMDYDFMKKYGRWAYNRWGTADHWPPSVQIQVAITAYWTRGFYPWPNTARMCGLL